MGNMEEVNIFELLYEIPTEDVKKALLGTYNEDLEKMRISIEKIKDPVKRKIAEDLFDRLSKKLDENTKNLPTLLSEHMINKSGK